MIYEDLDLRIQVSGNGFVVSAQRGSQNATAPFDPVRLKSWDLETLQRRGPDEVKKLGAALFNALIRDDVRRLYDQGRGSAGKNADKGLRIRILIDSRESRLQPFTKVPWEILYDGNADANRLLALDERRPIVRVIDSNEPPIAPAEGALRRVLLAWANPTPPKLDLEGECNRVKDALVRNNIFPEVLSNTTRSQLSERTRDYSPQIVHFMGHGSFNSLDQEGVLLLQGKQRAPDALRASDLARLFNGMAPPRLVILNACDTAVPGRTRKLNAFSSAAAALVSAGLPAVIAMQSCIGDEHAITFTERLYRRLLDNKPIEAAVADARLALKGADAYALDWAVPVLYMRSDGGGAVVTSDLDRPEPADRPASRQPKDGGHYHIEIEHATNLHIGPDNRQRTQ